MGNPKGVRRDFEKLEQRRFLAARLLQQGVPQAEVARRVGVHRQSVGRWAQQLAGGGRRSLKKAGRAGRKPRLKAADLRRIEHGLQRGPQALGYETRFVDLLACGAPDRERVRGPLPSFASLADSAAAGMELPAPGGTRSGAGRDENPGVETEALARD